MSDENYQEDFARIRKRLAEFYKPHEVNQWLRTPHPLLNGQPACDVIIAGRAAEVERAIDAFEAGVYL